MKGFYSMGEVFYTRNMVDIKIKKKLQIQNAILNY